MATVERTYLVACACSARLAATAGQAGDRLVCPACGRSVDVPRLRDLERCEVAVAAAAVHRAGWDAARGLLLAGAAIALVAAVAAATVPRIGGGMFPQPPDDDVIRAAVRAAPVVDVHAAWQSIAMSGVRRPPTDEEIRLEQFAKTAAGLSRVLWSVAALGAAGAAVGAALLASSRGRSAGSAP